MVTARFTLGLIDSGGSEVEYEVAMEQREQTVHDLLTLPGVRAAIATALDCKPEHVEKTLLFEEDEDLDPLRRVTSLADLATLIETGDARYQALAMASAANLGGGQDEETDPAAALLFLRHVAQETDEAAVLNEVNLLMSDMPEGPR